MFVNFSYVSRGSVIFFYIIKTNLFFLVVQTAFFMCVFPKVIILIMFMGGGVADPHKKFLLRTKRNRAPRDVSIDFKSRPPPYYIIY